MDCPSNRSDLFQLLPICREEKNGGVVSLSKSRAVEWFVTVPECCVTAVEGLVSTCEEVYVLMVFRHDFLHFGSVEISNNNEGCLTWLGHTSWP